jgi:hypothetical protein
LISTFFIFVEFLLLLTIFLRDFFRRYIVFTIYLLFIFLGDIFWKFVGPGFGFNYSMVWYYKMFWLVNSLEHILKILVMISFYRIVLRGYRHLRLMADCLFYGLCAALLLVFLLNFNPSATFLYNTSIYLGKYTFLFVSLVCTILLGLVALAGIRTERSFLLLLAGFLIFGLTQTLNFFYLSADPNALGGFWRWCYQVTFRIPLLCWFAAVLVPQEAEAGTFRLAGPGLQAQLAAGMLAMDRQAGRILKSLFPARL